MGRSPGISGARLAGLLRLFGAVAAVVVTFLIPVVSSTVQAAITGTGNCATVGNPLANPQTSDYTCTGDLTIDSGSVQTLSGDVTLTVNGTLTITGANSSLVVSPTSTYGQIVATNLSVGAGAFIDTDGKGCGPSLSFDVTIGSGCVNKGSGVTAGFGEGGDGTVSGGGGGYGGAGGAGAIAGAGGFTYGTATTPLELGSGGGNAPASPPSAFGGSGGGGIYIDVTGTLTVNGVIRSNGADGGVSTARTGGGGSGGAIYVVTSDLAGSGQFGAKGGDGGSSANALGRGGGGGGGGRIAVYYTGSNSFSGTLSCTGGAGGTGPSGNGSSGSAGTCTGPSLTTIATTLGDGTDPANSTVAPGSTNQYLDQFTFVTNSRTDSVTSLTVTTSNTAAIAGMKIMSDDMTTQYFGTLSSPTGANTWTFSGGTPIPVRVATSPDAFRIIVDFKTQAQLDAIGKVPYPVTGNVTTFSTTTHPQAGSDTNSATITVDNQPPANAVWGTISPGDSQVILNWTNPADADFSEVVILRNTASITDVPTDGVTYIAGGTIGTSTIVYVGNGTTFNDTGAVNGTSYFYKIFSRDIYINYASGVQTGPHTPVPVACNTIPNPLTVDFTCTGNLTVPDDTGSINLSVNGDIQLRVKGLLTVKTGFQIVVDPLNTYGTIVANDLNVQAGAFIDANGKGCGASLGFNITTNSGCTTNTTDGPGQGGNNTSNGGGGGAGYGGAGGAVSGNPGPAGGFAYGIVDLSTGIMQGSGGGNGSTGNLGGAGGGAIKIQVSGTLTVDGTIRANGLKGNGAVRSGGGGSGGSLHITAGTLAGTGVIQANGGDGGDGTLNGGGGGGGRVYIACTTCSMPLTSTTLQAMGGVPGAVGTAGEVGHAGSVFVLNDKTGNGPTSDDDLNVGGNGTLNGSLNINNLTVIQVGNSGNATRDQGTVIAAGDVTAAASITVQSGGNLATSGIHIITASTMTVNSGGAIHADGLGCPPSQSYDPALPGCVNKGSGVTAGFGEGGNDPVGNRGAGGAGYGGAGGAATGAGGGAGGFSYGDPDLTQVMLGSGGGSNPSNGILGGAGGGAVNMIISGTLTVDGTISADGSTGGTGTGDGGGGSGGSIFITVGTPAGTTGFIRTDGGNGPGTGGGGGGGRMRVEITGDTTFKGNCEASPGNAFLAGSGQGGSIIFRAKPDGTIDGFGRDQFGALGTGNGGESTRTTQALRTATYSLRLYNRDPFCSTETHTYHLFDTVPAGWSVEVVDNAGNKNTLPFDTGSLKAATFADFTVRVTPSTTAAAGTYDLILNIQTNNLSSNFVDSVTIRVKVAGADGITDGIGDNIYGALGTGGGGQSSRNVTGNVSTSYSLTVQNDSGVSDSYSISWALPSGWTGLPGGGQVVVNDGTTDQSPGFTTASIPAGGAVLFTVVVTPPATETLTQTIVLDIVSTTRPADSVDSVKVIAAMASATAAPIACTGAGAPSAGCLAPVAISSSQIKVYWVDNSNNETGFRIERAPRVGGACDSDEVYGVIFTLLRDTVGSPGTGQTLGYTDGGLAASTAYCYRFQAFNLAGNSAYSAVITATTLAAAETHVPAAVTDLGVEPGNQTQNSIMLSWTAPSDDNTVPGVGQAGSYDLRYATSPIVDGGAGAGQVDFSAATAVSGVAAPKAAGSFETATVSGLTPNTIYYFALKSTNTIGTSAMSNLAGGDNTTNGSAAGRTALRTNLNLVSVPLIPNPSDPDSVFQDDIGGVPQMWSWNSSGLGMVEGVDGCYDQYPPGTASPPCADITTIVPGQGYFIQGGGNRPVIDVPSLSTPVAVSTLCGQPNSYLIPLQVGWNIIGDPFPSNLTFSTVFVRQNGTTCADFGTAVTNGWVGNSLYDYNGSGYNFLLYSSAILEPWKGYWLWVRNNDVINGNTYELIVPLPP